MNKQTAQWIENHFDTAFSAPDGIKKLRELILTLAMQGRLVPQNPNDQPASELLKQIEAEKRRLVKEGKIKAPKVLPEIKAEEVPYALPEGWEWVRLGGITEYIQRGKGPSYSDTQEIPVISQKCIQWSGFNKNVVKFIDPITINKYQNERFIMSGDLLWNSTGTGTIGRINIYRDELLEFKKVVADSHVTVVRLIGILNEYILNFLMSPSVQSHIEENASGTTNQIELNTSTIINQIIPLPPLPEQHRIVAKIDQLMARCDELEKLRAEQEQKRLAVHTSDIKRLLDAQAKNSFDEAWQFITRHFGTLYSVKGNVTELRKAILQLAMKGKLSSPLDTDTPITSLIQRLQIEQKINPSIKQKEKDSIFNKLNAAHNNIMNNRVDLEAIAFCEFVTKGTTPSANELTTSGEIPFIKVYNIVNNTLDFNYKPSYVSLSVHRNTLKRSVIFPGDVIMNIVGPPLGKVAIITDQYPEWNMNQALAVFRPLGGINNRYIYYALSTDSVLESVLNDVKGTAGQDNLSLEQCRTIVIPVPSIEEQHRIVAKIDQLMALCDTLEQQIDAAAGKQTKLLSALMAQV